MLVISKEQLTEFAEYIIGKCNEPKLDEETWISAKEAATMLGVTKPTLWRWQRENYLVPTKRGSRNQYRKGDIKKLLEGRV